MKKSFCSYYLDEPLQKGRVFDVFEAESDVPLRDTAVFFVHGGAWKLGSRGDGVHILMQELSRRGYITASTDYRLDAKDAFVQLSDVRDAFDAFADLLIEMGRPAKIVIFGESAGAHLASLTAFALPGQCGEVVSELKHPEIRPVKAVLHATPYAFRSCDAIAPSSWEMMQNIAGAPYEKEPERYERLSLCNYINESNPPSFFIEGEKENLFFSEYSRRIACEHRSLNIRSQWKVYANEGHGFMHSLKRETQRNALDDMVKFIEGELDTEF